MTVEEFAAYLHTKNYPELEIASTVSRVLQDVKQKNEIIESKDREAYLSFVLQIEAASAPIYRPKETVQPSRTKLTVYQGEDDYSTKFDIRK